MLGIVILDAKFRPSPPRELIPETVLKYLHGLHPTTRPVLGLHLLHYGQNAEPVDYHHRPVTPAISTLPVHPDNKTHLGITLDRHLNP